jgi:hypothetical protein
MPKAKQLPPLEILEQWFSLEKETGKLHWIKKPAKKIRVGDEAGWRQNHNGLIRVSITVPGEGRFLRARVVWKMFYGSEPPAVVDHVDRNPLNDSPENLRDGTNGVNQRNKPVTSSTGLVGAFKCGNKWQSTIQREGRTVYLGVFETPEEANAAYMAAKVLLTGEKSNGQCVSDVPGVVFRV